MGIGVSGTFVILLMGLFIAMGTVYASGANTLEQISDARTAQAEHVEQVQESAINVTAVELTDSTNCDVEVRANNTGGTTLALNETDLLLDNTVETDWQDGASVDGDATTWLWLPGEQLAVSRTGLSAAPNGVSVVTKSGVTSRMQTEGLTC